MPYQEPHPDPQEPTPRPEGLTLARRVIGILFPKSLPLFRGLSIRQGVVVGCLFVAAMCLTTAVGIFFHETVTHAAHWVWERGPIDDDNDVPPPSPSPTASPFPVASITRATFYCGIDDYVEVRFSAEAPNEGQWFVLAQPVGNPNWYPSYAPLSDGGNNFRANVFTGPAVEYDLFVVLVPPEGVAEIDDYIADRVIDKRWDLGMDALPQGAITRAEQHIERDCGSGFDSTATPVAQAR